MYNSAWIQVKSVLIFLQSLSSAAFLILIKSNTFVHKPTTKTNICAILSTSTGCYTYLHRPHAVLGGQHSISVQTDRVCVGGRVWAVRTDSEESTKHQETFHSEPCCMIFSHTKKRLLARSFKAQPSYSARNIFKTKPSGKFIIIFVLNSKYKTRKSSLYISQK